MLWNPGMVPPTDWDQPLQDETQIKAKFYFCGQQHMAAAVHISKPRWSRWPEEWSQTGGSLSVGHRGIQLAKKQIHRETKSLRGFLAWCFPYVNLKMALTSPPPFIPSSLLTKAVLSSTGQSLLSSPLGWVTGVTYSLIVFHPHT